MENKPCSSQLLSFHPHPPPLISFEAEQNVEISRDKCELPMLPLVKQWKGKAFLPCRTLTTSLRAAPKEDTGLAKKCLSQNSQEGTEGLRCCCWEKHDSVLQVWSSQRVGSPHVWPETLPTYLGSSLLSFQGHIARSTAEPKLKIQLESRPMGKSNYTSIFSKAFQGIRLERQFGSSAA